MAELRQEVKTQEFERKGPTAGVVEPTLEEDVSQGLKTAGAVASEVASNIFEGDLKDLTGDELDLEELNKRTDVFNTKAEFREGVELGQTDSPSLSKRRIEELRDKNIRELQGTQAELQNLVNRGSISSFEAQASIDRQLRRMEKSLLGSLFSSELRDAVSDTTGNPGTSPALTILATQQEKEEAARNKARIEQAQAEQLAVSELSSLAGISEEEATVRLQGSKRLEEFTRMRTEKNAWNTLSDSEQLSTSRDSVSLAMGGISQQVHAAFKAKELTPQALGGLEVSFSTARTDYEESLRLRLNNKDAIPGLMEEFDKQRDAVMALANKISNQTMSKSEEELLKSSAVVEGFEFMPLLSMLTAMNKNLGAELIHDDTETIRKRLQASGYNVSRGMGNFYTNTIKFYNTNNPTLEQRRDANASMSFQPSAARQQLVKNWMAGVPLNTGFNEDGALDVPPPSGKDNEAPMSEEEKNFEALQAASSEDTTLLVDFKDPSKLIIGLGDRKATEKLNIIVDTLQHRLNALNFQQPYMKTDWLQLKQRTSTGPNPRVIEGVFDMEIPELMSKQGGGDLVEQAYDTLASYPYLWNGQYDTLQEAAVGIIQNGEHIDWKLMRDSFDPDKDAGAFGNAFTKFFGNDRAKLELENYTNNRNARLSEAEKNKPKGKKTEQEELKSFADSLSQGFTIEGKEVFSKIQEEPASFETATETQLLSIINDKRNSKDVIGRANEQLQILTSPDPEPDLVPLLSGGSSGGKVAPDNTEALRNKAIEGSDEDLKRTTQLKSEAISSLSNKFPNLSKKEIEKRVNKNVDGGHPPEAGF